jgi:hypothetical protein
MSTVAIRTRSTPQEASLTALYICVAAMPPPDVAPFAEPLLRLTTALLEATTTPPRLLGPVLRLLLAALPAVSLATLGQGFGDLADLLCGWALEPLVAPEDRCAGYWQGQRADRPNAQSSRGAQGDSRRACAVQRHTRVRAVRRSRIACAMRTCTVVSEMILR